MKPFRDNLVDNFDVLSLLTNGKPFRWDQRGETRFVGCSASMPGDEDSEISIKMLSAVTLEMKQNGRAILKVPLRLLPVYPSTWQLTSIKAIPGDVFEAFAHPAGGVFDIPESHLHGICLSFTLAAVDP